MPNIFKSTPGTVATFKEEKAIPGRVALEGFEPRGALITGVDYLQSTRQSFQNSLQGSVYVYVFGDNIGQVRVKGMILLATCEGGASGMQDVLNYYKSNRLSKRNVLITVFVADKLINGYLTGLELFANSTGDDPGTLTSNFSLTISALPNED
jgi:hypothetical protein